MCEECIDRFVGHPMDYLPTIECPIAKNRPYAIVMIVVPSFVAKPDSRGIASQLHSIDRADFSINSWH